MWGRGTGAGGRGPAKAGQGYHLAFFASRGILELQGPSGLLGPLETASVLRLPWQGVAGEHRSPWYKSGRGGFESGFHLHTSFQGLKSIQGLEGMPGFGRRGGAWAWASPGKGRVILRGGMRQVPFPR